MCFLVFFRAVLKRLLYLVLNVEVQLYVNESQSQNKRSLLTFGEKVAGQGEKYLQTPECVL